MLSTEGFEQSLKELSINFELQNDYYEMIVEEENWSAFNKTVKRHEKDSHARTVSWSTNKIPFFGTPFTVENVKTLECANGPKYFGIRKQEEGTKQNREGKPTRLHVQPSKKLGCEAIMKFVQIKIYPQFKLKGIKNQRQEKSEVSSNLKNKLESDSSSVMTKRLFYVSLSALSVHSHSVSTSFLTQELDSSLKLKIKDYVEQGITNIPTLKTLLESYVEKNFSGDIPTSSRAFYPTKKTIYNFVMKYLYQSKQSRLDDIPVVLPSDPPSDSLMVVVSAGNEESDGESIGGSHSSILPASVSESSNSNSGMVVNFACIQNAVKDLYDTVFLLSDDGNIDYSPLYDKLIEARNLMNNFITTEKESNNLTLLLPA